MNDQEQARILEELDIILAGTSEPLWMVGVSKTKSSQGAGTAEAFEGIESTNSAKFGELHARQGMAEARRRESLEGHIDPSDKSFGGEVGAALKAAKSIRVVDKMESVKNGSLRARQGWQSVETRLIYQNDAETKNDGQNLEVFGEKLKCACRRASTMTDRTELFLAKLTRVVDKEEEDGRDHSDKMTKKPQSDWRAKKNQVGATMEAANSIKVIEGEPVVDKGYCVLHKLADARRRERLEGKGILNDSSLGDEIEGDARQVIEGEAIQGADQFSQWTSNEESAKKEQLRARRGMADARRKERLEGKKIPNDSSFGGEIEGNARKLVGPEAAAKIGANMKTVLAIMGSTKSRRRKQRGAVDAVRRRTKLEGSPAESSRGEEEEGDEEIISRRKQRKIYF
jgi:hypothetical protein